MKIYPISRLMSKAFIIHVKSWINTSIVLYLLSGSSKAGQVWERGMSRETLCPHHRVQTWEQSQGLVLGSINSPRPQHRQRVMSWGQGPPQESHQQQKLMGPETGYNGGPNSSHVRELGTSAPSITGAGTDDPRLRLNGFPGL